MKHPRYPISLLSIAVAALLTGCVTHITTDITQNPPPAEKLSGFTKFEMAKVALVAPYAGQKSNERALAKIQENVTLRMDPMLATWTTAGATATSTRTLVITPVVAEIKFISGGSRFWAGAFAGSSAIILTAKITEKETGKVVANPTFYAHAAAMGGAWTFGATDNLMLARIAGRLTGYLEANYPAAVGGPSGADPATK